MGELITNFICPNDALHERKLLHADCDFVSTLKGTTCKAAPLLVLCLIIKDCLVSLHSKWGLTNLWCIIALKTPPQGWLKKTIDHKMLKFFLEMLTFFV